MPPKPAAVTTSSDGDAADHEKEFVEKELTISFLKTRLSRHQERGDVLFVENARLGQDLETQKLNLADINEFLTSELEASAKKLRQMEDKADALQQQVDDARDTHTNLPYVGALWRYDTCRGFVQQNRVVYFDEHTVVQTEVARIEKDHSVILEEKESTIQDMEKKVKTSQQFLDQKDTMDSALQQLQQTLELERKQHKEQIGDLERQHVQDKDAWRKNTAQQLKETRERMQKLSENQLETLTKRTILENEAMAAELKYQSRQKWLLERPQAPLGRLTHSSSYGKGPTICTGVVHDGTNGIYPPLPPVQVELMVAKNQALLTEKAKMKMKAQLADQTEQELAKKSQVFQKTIKNLLSKLMEEEQVKRDRDAEFRDLRQVAHERQAQVNALKHELMGAGSLSASLQQELQFAREQQSQLRAGQDDLQACMDDIHRDMLSGDSTQDSMSKMTLEQRRHALATLLSQWQAFKENRRDRSPGKGGWRLGKQGDDIKAAKALQHPHIESQGVPQTSDGLIHIPSQVTSPIWRGEIGVVDSVLSLEGSPAAARGWGQRAAEKNALKTYASRFAGMEQDIKS
ncbi:hypothetical protein ABBQ38_014050 [Trebouxia sp. C0009 RCD-2024]